MNEKEAAPQHIAQALKLDGSAEALKTYYRQWAESYNHDLQGDYIGASVLCDFFRDSVFAHAQGDRNAVMDAATLDAATPDAPTLADLKIADMGCGTGLVGQVLWEQGARIIDGMDLSPDMVEQARQLTKGGHRVYRSLYGDVDLNQPIPAEWRQSYDVTLCCGVFTLGHVHPKALYQLLNMTRSGGVVVLSTRTSYYESSGYQAVNDEVVNDGTAHLLACLKDAPYTKDSDAHYWAYQVN